MLNVPVEEENARLKHQLAHARAENARLAEGVQARTAELTEALEYQSAAGDVLNLISQSPEIQPALDRIVETAARLCDAKRAFIYRVDGSCLRPAASHNVSLELLEFTIQHPISPGRHSGVARAALERRTVHIPDVRSDPEYTFHAAQIDPIRTVLAVPMLKNDELVGVVVIYRLDVRPFSKKQIDLVTTFANQAAIAIENVRLFDEVQARTAEVTEALEYQTATSDVLNVISRSPSEVQAVFDSIVRTARRLCEAERASVLQLEDGKYHAVAIDGVRNPDFDQELAATPIAPDRSSITGRTVLEGRVIHVHDAEADPEFTYLRDHGFEFRRTMLGVPLLRDQRVLGVIVLDRPIVKPFTDKQIELVETFADQAVIAIENVRLFDEVQSRTRELEKSLKQQTATADVLKAISRSTFDLQSVLQTLVEFCGPALRSRKSIHLSIRRHGAAKCRVL